MRTIALEEHYATPAFVNGPGQALKQAAAAVGNTELLEQLSDLGERRIADMDAAGLDMQVLSLTAPGVEQLEPAAALTIARDANDLLAAAVRRHPQRLAGFATLPTPEPRVAADELERAVRDHGFKGAIVNGHVRGRYLSDAFFWPILERAEALQVPIYLHPTPPPKPVIDAYYAGFAPDVTARFSTAGWGWHIETAVHVVRLILSGAFDRFPNLQIIIGHMGEALPFMLPRLEHTLPTATTKLQRTTAAYLRQNVHYTFSGFNWTANILNLLLQVGADRIMFSTDYPYASMREARTFLDRLPVSDNDRERIAHRNAEQLLRL